MYSSRLEAVRLTKGKSSRIAAARGAVSSFAQQATCPAEQIRDHGWRLEFRWFST